ncbi:SAUR-like auxin-responsive protein family [Euphorbia peplus]|nr:SAUR-like auxin-responsive protein family [Euphorbia peplus]
MYQFKKILSQREREPKVFYQPLLERHVQNQDEEKRRRPRKGYVAIYVGEEGKRYEVPIKCLSCKSFQEIMSEKQDLESHNQGGPLKLLCSPRSFDNLLKTAKRK